MSFEYAPSIGSLYPEQRLHFYELFAHNLTISIRSIWSDSVITDAEKLDQIKWVNEIMHRITSKIYHLRLNQNTMSDSDTWQTIEHWVSQNPAIGDEVTFAIMYSYNYVVRLKDEDLDHSSD